MQTESKSKRILLAAIIAALVFCVASGIVASGTSGEVGVNTRTISGTPTPAVLMYSLTPERDGYIVNGFKSEDESYVDKKSLAIEIPATYDDGISGEHPVVEIAEKTFNVSEVVGGSVFKSLNLSKATGLKTIGTYAFWGCRTMNGDLIIPSSELHISNYAFRDCEFTGALILPDTIQTIECGAFYDCSFGEPLSLPGSVVTIEELAFADSSFVNSLTLPDSVKTIGRSAFNSCSIGGSLTLSADIETIGEYAFAFCEFTGVLYIPGRVKSIGKHAFNLRTGFKTVYLPNNDFTTYGESIFFGYDSSNSPIVAPNKALYDKYREKDHALEKEGYLTYETTVMFDVDGAADGIKQIKLVDLALSYEKDVESGVWSNNRNYTLPQSNNGYNTTADGSGAAVTKDIIVSEAAVYYMKADSSEHGTPVDPNPGEQDSSEPNPGVPGGETPSTDAPKSEIGGGAIAGIVIAAVVVAFALTLLALFVFRKNKSVGFKAYYASLAKKIKGKFGKSKNEVSPVEDMENYIEIDKTDVTPYSGESDETNKN